MPYIKKERRQAPNEMVPMSAGELNYLITSECIAYLPDWPTYKDFNEIIGVLECVKQEFYRRAMAPYEDKKSEENGDLY